MSPVAAMAGIATPLAVRGRSTLRRAAVTGRAGGLAFRWRGFDDGRFAAAPGGPLTGLRNAGMAGPGAKVPRIRPR
jgi:hypothetical protein